MYNLDTSSSITYTHANIPCVSAQPPKIWPIAVVCLEQKSSLHGSKQKKIDIIIIKVSDNETHDPFKCTYTFFPFRLIISSSIASCNEIRNSWASCWGPRVSNGLISETNITYDSVAKKSLLHDEV